MQRSQLRDFSSWMTRLLPDSGDGSNRVEGFKMFGTKNSSPTSTFYTDLEVTTDDDKPGESFAREDECPAKAPPPPLRQSESQRTDDGEDGNSQDSEDTATRGSGVEDEEEEQQYARHSFHRIASFGGFPRFQPFVMSASTPAEHIDITTRREEEETLTETSYIKMSHSVLEYRSSRYVTSERRSHQYTLDTYAVSESESEEESDETRQSSEIDSVVTIAATADRIADTELGEPKKGSPDSTKKERKRRKALHVARELLATERNYVNTLHLIDQVFQFRVDQENRAHPMFPPETIQHMFSNIKSIYKFHNDFLLPRLEERIQGIEEENWDSENPRIGDIMKNLAPFLKMYTEYVKNFDHATNLIGTLQNKVPRFAAIVTEIQKLDECAKLSLSHHMLSPIQRLPRYELLLKDYLRNLTEDNPDYDDTQKALKLVSTAANHTNEAMKKIDKFKKLLEIQESIYDVTDLVSATRELVKEGRIVKISARSGDHQERHLFLFSDLLLLCSIRLIPGPLYRLRAKFMVENLQVIEGDNLETANTFYIRDENKNVELYTQSTAEKAAWLDALFQTMREITRRKASLKTGGNAKTRLVRADDVTRCMICEVIFSVMKRKHNCRACGIVVCNKCSNHKLLFQDNKNMRVCRLCHAALTQPLAKSPSSPSAAGPVPSLLQVSASAPSVLSGYLSLKTQAGKPWTRRWFALHVDFVLYSFKTEVESTAMTATPMPGFTVTEGTRLPDEDPLNTRDRIRAFKIYHSRKCYYLQASSQQNKQKWMYALELATKAELPHFTQPEDENAQENQSPNDVR